MVKIICAISALLLVVVASASACPDSGPTCPDGSVGVTQWTAANSLADLYCAAHPYPDCVKQVVSGWCIDEADCAGLICGDRLPVYNDCREQATAGTLPAVCWTLFQF
ncbi:MAG TPA: hypothetical protein VN253_04600 [Kofleriaceae bacterium]|nr:hypothetical protein [Kofleriaceae bacterium]